MEEEILVARAKTFWEGNVRTNTIIRGFEVASDAPISRFGTNTAPAPTELLLSSVGACFTSNFTRNLFYGKIVVDNVTTSLKAFIRETDEEEEITGIELKLKVKAKEECREVLEGYFEKTNRKCPITNVLKCDVKTEFDFVPQKED